MGKNQSGKRGWVDKNGNIWVPVPDGSPQAHGGGHWDVQRPDGKGYTNKYPGGAERKGSGKRPNLPEVPDSSTIALQPSFPNISTVVKDVVDAIAGVAGLYVTWQVVKWVGATIAAPYTCGGSYALAAATP